MSRLLLPGLLLIIGLFPSAYYFPVLIVVAVGLFLLRGGKLPVPAFRPLAPLALLALSGFLFADWGPASYDVLKDVWYVSKVMLVAFVGLLLGLLLAVDRNWLRQFTRVALVLSAVNVFLAVLDRNIETARHLSYVAVLLTPFIWRYYQGRGILEQVVRMSLLILVVVMIVLSGSRTGVLILFVSYLAVNHVLHTQSRFLMTTLALGILMFLVVPLLPQYDFANITFLGKIQNALNEITFETGDDRLRMYANWRGFEAYRAYQTWISGSLPEQIFGMGFGTAIDLGNSVAYGDSEDVRSLPFIHNAYFTLLVKTGIVGVVAIIVFMIYPFRLPYLTQTGHDYVLSQLARASAVTLLITTVLISGPLNRESLDGVLLVWGWSSGALIRMMLVARAASRRAAMATAEAQNEGPVAGGVEPGAGRR
ncbi:O-antigen ligase family protein [Gimibacter soli]|uniref:O-antigen ligase family protein n=1 Tax=Gimibacter soli TaxID=3024400 RepID=A0AAE9XV51_9PROT|nr:O-antigen ligase family protein [Gimibacter soli]WCL53379.1 O-antigen ligase family protein [Gimibacter soli]